MTISDIAKLAGVSSAAVSRYLNGGPLSEQKRAVIQAVVEKTGYSPDTAAQTLRTGKVRQVGVIVPSISSQSVGQITSGIATELSASRYLMLLADTELDEQMELEYLTALQRNHVAGIILLGYDSSPQLCKALKDCRVPVVVTGQRFADLPCVYNDDRSAARDLTRKMLEHGRKNIVYIGGSEQDPATGIARRQGVQDALREAGLNADDLPRAYCAVESAPQIAAVAQSVKAAGAQVLRGGAFKPRTSPYTFQGLGGVGVELLVQAGRDAGLPVITEITDVSQLPLLEDVDILQVGARNMQNYALLKALGELRRPVMLKRGLSATVEEFLLAAEYILSGGNEQVILCERGVQSGLSAARSALDVAAIPVLKKATHLPVLVDPSHAAGRSELVLPLALAAAAAGADGLMVEVHDRPACALSDGGQALTCRQFQELTEAVNALLPHAWRGESI